MDVNPVCVSALVKLTDAPAVGRCSFRSGAGPQ